VNKSTLAKVTFVSLLLIMISISDLFGGSFCQQTIELTGKTDEDTSRIYYYEYVSGECEGHQMFELTITKDSVLSQKSWSHDYLKFPHLSDSLKNQRVTNFEPALRLFERDGNFGFQYRPVLLSTSKKKYEENKIILDSMVKHGGPLPKKIENPDFNVEAKLIYSKPGGIYLNYEIHEAYLFRKSHILFIVTHQPRMMTAYDTLHGVLIYKFKEDI